MKYYARCTDKRGNEVQLTVKEESPKAAVARLMDKYTLESVDFLSLTPVIEPEPIGFWSSTAACVKSSKPHPGRVKGRSAVNI